MPNLSDFTVTQNSVQQQYNDRHKYSEHSICEQRYRSGVDSNRIPNKRVRPITIDKSRKSHRVRVCQPETEFPTTRMRNTN